MGTLVSSLVDFALPAGQVDNVTDADTGALLGIAVTAADTANGTWYYSTNGGTNWNALGAVADNNARLLAADANTRLYFQPNANYNGTLASAITFRAWDQTSGSNGSLANTSTNGGTTAFSSATDTASLVINAVNDAPVLNNSGTMSLATITEDNTANSGDAVGSIILSRAGGDRITDVDSAFAYEGFAVTGLVSGNGTCGSTRSTAPAGLPSAVCRIRPPCCCGTPTAYGSSRTAKTAPAEASPSAPGTRRAVPPARKLTSPPTAAPPPSAPRPKPLRSRSPP